MFVGRASADTSKVLTQKGGMKNEVLLPRRERLLVIHFENCESAFANRHRVWVAARHCN